MDAARVFAPAVEYAEQGYALTVKNAFFYAGAAANLRRFKTGADIYLLDGAAPEPGEVVVQKALAETFRQVAAEGADVFYKGAIADRMVHYYGGDRWPDYKRGPRRLCSGICGPSLHQLSRL